MAYNNRGGWNNGYGGGPNRGGYNNGPRYNNNGWGNRNDNYDNRNNGPQQGEFEFDLGQPVRHIATGLKLSVIKFGREQIECRTPDLRSEYFYPHELEPWTEE